MKRIATILLCCCLLTGCRRFTPDEERGIASRLHCGVSVFADDTLSLTFTGEVADLSGIRGLPVSGLELVGVKQADLSCLEGVELRSICFLADHITNGIGTIRNMASLQKINRLPAAEFWKRYDAGEFRSK